MLKDKRLKSIAILYGILFLGFGEAQADLKGIVLEHNGAQVLCYNEGERVELIGTLAECDRTHTVMIEKMGQVNKLSTRPTWLQAVTGILIVGAVGFTFGYLAH